MNASLLATFLAMLFTPQSPPAFDAASIKPSTERESTELRFSPGRISVRGATLSYLIEQAYGVQPLQISGGPAWLNSSRFDVEAKADGSHNRDELLRMLQTLLADRFKLSFHRETKELPVDVLTVAKNGTKLQPSSGPQTAEESDPTIVRRLIRGGPRYEVTGQRVTLLFLASFLARRLNQIVRDKTGLSGEFDFKVELAIDVNEAGNPNIPMREVTAHMFADLAQKMGLRLESQKLPVEVLMVDHVETPGEN